MIDRIGKATIIIDWSQLYKHNQKLKLCFVLFYQQKFYNSFRSLNKYGKLYCYY